MDVTKLPKLSNTSDHRPAPNGTADGSSITGKPVPGSFCTQCGTCLTPAMKFCGVCGAPVQKSAGDAVARANPIFNNEPERQESPTMTYGPEAWISMAVGAILLLLVPTMLQYASSKIFGTTFAPFPDPFHPYPAKCDFIAYDDGTRIYYRQMPQFWSDLGVTLFGLVLIVDGLAIYLFRRWILFASTFLLTLLATGYNLVYVATHLQPLPIISALAVVFGGYMLYYQWTILRTAHK